VSVKEVQCTRWVGSTVYQVGDGTVYQLGGPQMQIADVEDLAGAFGVGGRIFPLRTRLQGTGRFHPICSRNLR